MEYVNLKYIASAIIFSLIGLGVLALGLKLFDRMTPGTLWKEIIEEHNVALAIIVGAMALSMAQIIASAIHG